MSMKGLIRLIEFAKNGARFGILNDNKIEITNIDEKDLLLAEDDVIRFLSYSSSIQIEPHSEDKTIYRINKYSSQYLWLYENITKKSSLFNIPISKEIIGNFNCEQFVKSLNDILLRYKALRCRYKLIGSEINSEIIAHKNEMLDFLVSDISLLDVQQQRLYIERELDLQDSLPFDLVKEFPIRCRILKKGNDAHYLFLTFHHCVVDGWTANILMRELGNSYKTESNTIGELKDNAFFRFLENPFMAISDLDESLSYWFNELLDAPERHSIEYDIAIPHQDKNVNVVREHIDGDLYFSLNQLAQANGTTIFTVLHTAFALFISRESDSNSVVIGSPVANRHDPELNSAIGSFVNTVAYHFRVDINDSFLGMLKKTSNKLSSSFKHQRLPFPYLVEKFKPLRGNYHPIFQIMFVCQHRKNSELDLGNCIVRNLPRKYSQPKFDLVLEVVSTSDGIHLEWQYNPHLYTIQRIDFFVKQYIKLLEEIVANPSKAITYFYQTKKSNLSLLTSLSCGEISSSFMGHKLYDLLNLSAKNNKDKIALISEGVQWSYEEIFNVANNIATWLYINTPEKSIIAIDLPRGTHQALSVLGVILAKRIYMPIAEGLPDARVETIMNRSGCDWVICSDKKDISRYPNTTKILVLGKLIKFMDHNNQDKFKPAEDVDQELAYIIYTSGTTGIPKGVAIEHRSVSNTLLSMNTLFNINHHDSILALSDLSFDLSVYDLFGSWLAGTKVVLLSPSEKMEPALWLQHIIKNNITIWNSVPAILHLFVEYCDSEDIIAVHQIKTIWLSGDKISTKLISSAHRLFPNASITSLGGATEGSIWSIYHSVSRHTYYRNSIPYGRPLPNQSMWVLDQDLSLCDFGKVGDIYIGGEGVALGYWNDQHITVKSFIKNTISNKRLYRTGDRGRWHHNGYIEFLGREDQQVKLQGYRVELGDVESALNGCHLIADACVKCTGDHEDGSRKLEAYITLTNEGVSCHQVEFKLREHLNLNLPSYMVPKNIYIIESFPLTANGKLDRSLLIPELSQKEELYEYNTVSISGLSVLQSLLAETLNSSPEHINSNTSFFNNGGSSLLGITFLSKIKQSFKVELSLSEILGYKDLPSLLEIIEGGGISKLSEINRDIHNLSLPTIYLIHGAGGHVNYYLDLISKIREYANIITIACPHLGTKDFQKKVSLQQVALSHLNEISHENRGDAIIAGWSLGGQIAINMAALASEQGAPFAHSVVIDSNYHNTKNLDHRHFSISHCFLGLFDSLGIKRSHFKNKKFDENIPLIHEVENYYKLNKGALGSIVSLAQVESFCIALKKSFDMMKGVSTLPNLEIPITIWQCQSRIVNDPNLTLKWNSHSSKDVRLIYCDENHYSILKNPSLEEELVRLLCELS